ncbi:MAG TPA: hypothetical protein VLJ39_00435 [Tepidisphaeraceae bacterium]|nr:hypothetical protein [Tepidisphaeraceae bacterium]
MRQQFFVAIGVLLGVAAWAAAGSDTKPAAESDSPRQALKSQDAAARSGDVEADLAFYQADDEQQKALAAAMARGDVAVARLESAVEKRFGKDLAASVARAAGSEDVQSVDRAEEHLTGDHATIQFRDQKSSVPMVRSNGRWKISLADWTQDVKADQVKRLADGLDKLAHELDHLRDLVEHDKFRSGEGVRDRVQSLHDQLFEAK